jgi:hypothetical protein
MLEFRHQPTGAKTMTIAQSTTIQAYQLRKGGTPARMAILRMMAGDWRRARNWTMKNYAAAYCSGINQGFDGESPIWYSHSGAQFRNERDACDVVRLQHTGWFTDRYQDETAVGIIASLPHGRFIAGYRWTSNDERVYFDDVFTNEDDAARIADEHARVFAENCRDNEEIEYEE